MIDHTGVPVSDYQKSKEFYTKALAPIGYTLVMEFGEAGGFGENGKPDFWISKEAGIGHPNHIAFVAQNHAAVDAFYKEAIAAGGTDNGAPGIRGHYHPNYYGAFVKDFDGHNVEVVCHKPE